MATIIENIEIDETNEEFFLASELVKYGHKLIYLTGKAGTGKTTFLKYLRQTTKKNNIVLAYTGVAAINAGGQTINSFFKIPFGPFLPNDKRLRPRPDINDEDKSTIYNHFQYNTEKLEIIRGLELLIIDEISMVRCDLLDVIDKILRIYRKRENQAFGGLQVILIGDTFQLPPIDKDWHILEPFYESTFFFSSKVIQDNKPVYIELKKIYRQNEQEFIELLNRVRINNINQNELNLLNSKFDPNFSPNAKSSYITLATHNNIVERTNLSKLSELPGDIQLFEAIINNDFPENIMPTERVLQIKEGAQIMFIKNDKPKRIYNGKIARIKKIEHQKITVEYEDNGDIIEFEIEKQIWNNIRYNWNDKEKKIDEEIIGTFTQYPIKLAWAITVHKSQGLTFEKVIADIGSAFASGQVYVALSRCTSFNGLILKSKIDFSAIKTDAKVIEFAKNETPGTLIVKELNSGKADFYYEKLREDIKLLDFEGAYVNFIKAIKLRNDIETDIFRKYFITTANKIGSYRKKHAVNFNELIKELQKNEEMQFSISNLKIENLNQQTIINEQQKTIDVFLAKTRELEKKSKKLISDISILEIENLNQQTTINEKQKTIENLLNRTEDLEEKCEKTNSEISVLTTEKMNIEINIQQIKKTRLEQILYIAKLENTIENHEKEIKRIGTLKWYHKLFGQH